MVRALRLDGRATAAARWCTCRRAAVALCVANLIAALLVARALYALGSFAFAPKREEATKAFAREEKTQKGLPLELNQKVSLEILQRLHDLGEGSNTMEQQEAIEAWRVGKLKDMGSTSSKNLSNFGLSSEDSNEEIIPGPPLPPELHTELHTDYGGTAVRWGLTHHKESVADCCQACIDQAKRARPGALKCNIWVYCRSEYGCYSPDKYENKHQECWLKQ
ncbi:Methionine aminopeptidase 1D chloroplastic/mitochondrial, partial [Zea mays]